MGVERIEAIVAGGSAGGVEALSYLLPTLPADFEPPVVVVLHVLPTRPSGLAELLAPKCALAVKEVEDKEPIAGGTVYFAPANYHVLVEKDRTFALSVDPPLHYSRPSIDVLFESAADAYGRGLMGVLLTGANQDGAEGLARIKRAGGTTVVQSPESAVARAMPLAALQRGPHDHVLDLPAIAALLASIPRAKGAKKGGAR